MQSKPFRLMAAAAALTVVGLAHAGQCPADKVAANDLPGAATAPVGVVDTELASIDLANQTSSSSTLRMKTSSSTSAVCACAT